MKRRPAICLVFVLFFSTLACRNARVNPEPYSSYLSIHVVTPDTIAAGNSNKIQLLFKNESDKIFEKECSITYSLEDSVSGIYYSSIGNISNKQVPDKLEGLLNISNKNTYVINIDLSELKWKNIDYNNILPNKYAFDAQLFIKDPYSPASIIRSNQILVEKK